MTTEPKQKMRSIIRMIRQFDEAAQAYAFKGAADLQDRFAIEHRYQSAKEALVSIIERNLK